MGTSLLGGTILFDTGDFNTDEPVDTVLVQDALIGSALHKADQAAQVRACWGALADAHLNDPEYLEIRDVHGSISVAGSTAAWYAFPVRGLYAAKLKADGSGYRMRVWLAGCSSAGDAVDFAIALVPGIGSPLVTSFGGSISGVVKYYTNETSTTPAALTPDDGENYIDIPVTVVQAALQASGVWATQEDIGGDATAVQVAIFEVLLLGQTHDADSVPRVYGYACADYYG